ncbi:MAG TPA: hypothetical protein VGX28_13350 [Frankiaceae bacterium]|jgi:hypothetical protein|nr:hypothetical protein [Frankiaceae bacterium]
MPVRLLAAAALAAVAVLPAVPASACHQPVAPFEVGPVSFPGVQIPC